MTAEVTFVRRWDYFWEAVYVNGVCKTQGEGLDAETVLEELSKLGIINLKTLISTPSTAGLYPNNVEDVIEHKWK